MNINKLIEALQYGANAKECYEAATMLRQQQAENDELKNDVTGLVKIINQLATENEALKNEIALLQFTRK